jgi:hypothetical protein
VLLNVGLVAWFICRKRNKRLREGTVGSVLGESMFGIVTEHAFGLSWTAVFLCSLNRFLKYVTLYFLGRIISEKYEHCIFWLIAPCYCRKISGELAAYFCM